MILRCRCQVSPSTVSKLGLNAFSGLYNASGFWKSLRRDAMSPTVSAFATMTWFSAGSAMTKAKGVLVTKRPTQSSVVDEIADTEWNAFQQRYEPLLGQQPH